MSSSSGMNRFPFTASQYQELEHQALIFKYIISGMQIPPELLFSMKRTSCLDSPFSSPSSKFPDSKYCERHMHRGKNRSRKPVETTTTTTTSSSSPSTTTAISSSSAASNASLSISSMNKNPYSLNQSSDTHHHSSAYSNAYLHHHHGHHPFSYSSSRSPGIGLSPSQDKPTNFLMDTGSYAQDYRRNGYLYGIKENVDEHAFFAEPSGAMKSMDDSWQLTPLTISSSSSSKQSSDYSYLQLQSHSKQDEPHHQKTIHRFFDEGPVKGRDSSWIDVDEKSSTTTTKLSISMPSSSYSEFSIFSSRRHLDN